MQKGVLRVPCKADGINDPLLKVGQSTTVVAVGTSPTTAITQFTIPIGRGDVQAIDIFVGSTTVADLVLLFGTVLANGIQILQDDPMIAYTSLFQNSKKTMVITIPEGAVITGSFANGSASIIRVLMTYYFYNPYRQ